MPTIILCILTISYFRRIYSRKGQILKKGDKLKNKPLANTLETIANAGSADVFYTGKMARQFVKDVKRHKGIITLADLKNYKALEKEPLVSKLGEYTMLNTPAPASGAVLAYILNILKGKGMLLFSSSFFSTFLCFY